MVFIFGAQSLQRVGLRGFAFADFVEPGERSLIGFEPGFAFFYLHRAVVLDTEPADDQRQT
jgi:hypothetical protein